MTPRPDGCPQCRSEKGAGILYGLPSFDEGLERRLHAGEVVLVRAEGSKAEAFFLGRQNSLEAGPALLEPAVKAFAQMPNLPISSVSRPTFGTFHGGPRVLKQVLPS